MVSKTSKSAPSNLPLLPLRDVVVYPHMVVPLFVGRERSITALESAMENDKRIVLVTQRDPSEDDPGIEDVYEVGTLATVLQMLKLPDGTLKVLVEGLNRVSIADTITDDDFMVAPWCALEINALDSNESDALIRSTNNLFEQYVNLSKKAAFYCITMM